ncbi:MAG: cytochrome c oxidase subunit II [Proteobacteria bacterium]|nr:cytochrome c oxidase subunit II [Pseudomonadota bacterium]
MVFASYFDDAPLKFSPGMEQSPMYTLVGITDWGRDIMHVYGLTTLIVTFVFFAVLIPTVYVLFKFRARGEDQPLPEQVKGNHVLEIVWTVIPVILLIMIAVPTWQSIFKQDRAVKAIERGGQALKIEVIGYQWWWEFKYVDYDVVTANELVLPENTPIAFSITSYDVIHSFYIPRFGGKIDAIPGKINKLVYYSPPLSDNASAMGDYYQGQCMELCGLSHALMRFEAVVKSKEAFQKFIASHNTPPQVKTEKEKRGEVVFNQCMSCHTIAGTPSADLEIVKIGPDLSNFGNRRTLGAGTRKNTMENLRNWIRNPLAFKPGSLMPKFDLTDEQIEDVSAYIQYSTAKDL